MARPKIPVRAQTIDSTGTTVAPKISADEQFQNDMAKIQGEQAFYNNPSLSKKRKKAVAIKMGNR